MNSDTVDNLNSADLFSFNANNPNQASPDLHVYYHDDTKDYYVPAASDGWVKVNERGARDHLASLCYSPENKDGYLSEVGRLMNEIRRSKNVQYVGALAGYAIGFYNEKGTNILVTSEPKFLTPAKGEWSTIKKLAENLFGDEQLPYVYGWLKVSMEMYRSQKWMAGQIFVMAGPINSGKNLFSDLVNILFGNRQADPYSYMAGKTQFNSDLFGAELLAMHDRAESTDINTRKSLAGHMKGVAVNRIHRYERKHCNAITINPRWRMVITVNDEPERLKVLPPMEKDLTDKVMLFRVERRQMPMPTNTLDEQDAFWAQLMSELPAFAYFIQEEWIIQPDLVSSRFGITHYQHPDLLQSLSELDPEERLRGLLSQVFSYSGDTEFYFWEGTSMELEKELKGHKDWGFDAKNLLKHHNSCGTYMARLAKKYPDEIRSKKVHNTCHWEIELSEWKERLAKREAREAEARAAREQEEIKKAEGYARMKARLEKRG